MVYAVVMRLWGMIATLTMISCRESAYNRALKADLPQSWRQFLQENPRDENIEAAEVRLAELEFDAAKQAHSIAAYKRFIEAYPGSEQSTEARNRLESLRFLAAIEKNSTEAVRQFLYDHPDGSHREEALAALAQLEVANQAATTASTGDLNAADDAVFAKAQTTGDFLAYLRAFPAGVHRDEARAKLVDRQIDALIFSGLVHDAKMLAEKSPWASAIHDLRDRISRAEKIDRSIHQKNSLAFRASFLPYVRSAAALMADLSAADAKTRWQAADEYGYVTSIQSVGPLIDAIRHSHLLLVRMRAFMALDRLFHSLPRAVVEYEVSSRIDRQRESIGDERLHLTAAVLLDALGEVDQSLAVYRQSFDPGDPDPLILWRLAELHKRRGRAFSAAISAHRMRLASVGQLRHTGSLDATNALAVAREQCSMREALLVADEIFTWASRESVEFPEDLKRFQSEADLTRRQTEARLRDAEGLAQTDDASFSPCARDEISEKMAAAKIQRSRALDALKRMKSKEAHAVAEFISTMWEKEARDASR